MLLLQRREIMDIFKTNLKDSVHWLKVAMRQAQSDIKSNKGKILELENQVEQLKKDLEDIKNNS